MGTITQLAPHELCNGCMACYNKCPRNAIKIIKDSVDFIYPEIDRHLCNNCGLCNKVCTVYQYNKNLRYDNPIVIAAYSKNAELRKDSSSGGIFSELANYIFDVNGYVAGAIYTKNFEVRHIITNNKEKLPKYRGAKYSQSSVGTLYADIKLLLAKNKIVFICGTPCQIMGLYNYLGKDYENLYTADLICHGVNSPGIFKRYIQTLENKYKSKVKKIKQRDKTYGWHMFSTKVWFGNKKVYISNHFTDKFMKGFLEYHYYMRESCFACKFRKLPRVADLTLADFWGIEQIKPNMDQNLGTSVIMINSKKGEKIFSGIKSKLIYENCTYATVCKGNPALFRSSSKNPNAELFIEDINTKKFKNVWNRYIPDNSLEKRLVLFHKKRISRINIFFANTKSKNNIWKKRKINGK